MNARESKLRQFQEFLAITVILILPLFVFSGIMFAQEAVKDNSLKSYKLPSNIRKYFQDKYKNKDNTAQIEEISSNFQETPHGPSGGLNISGHLRLKNVEATSGDKQAHARAIAMAFLKEEAEVLGLPDLNELRESEVKTVMGHDGEYTHIYCRRYIGDIPLEYGHIHIVIGPDESIHHVIASLKPVPSETYQAVTKKMITEDEALNIVKRDLKAHGSDPNTMKVFKKEKFASAKAPYVSWVINALVMNKFGRWEYLIDAFTGDILRKTNKMIED